MTEPRLHLLARQAAARIALGHDPQQAIVDALSALADAHPLGGIYDQLAPKAKAVCRALWGEKAMRAVDVVRITGDSLHSTNDCLYRLMRAGYVRRVRHGHYEIMPPELRPTSVNPLSYYRPGDPRIEVRRALHRRYRAELRRRAKPSERASA